MESSSLQAQKNDFPLVFTAKGVQSATDLCAWVNEQKGDLLKSLQTSGAALLRGADVKDALDFASVVESFGLKNYPYVGGAAVRRNIVKDIVFTANESPPSEPIPFHHEIAQSPNPPAYVFFYCDIAAEVGGETPIILSNDVYEFGAKNHPSFFKEMEEKGVQYVRTMPMEDDVTSAIGRSWKNTFLCETKAEAEAKMTELGTTWEWLANGDLKTVTAVVPAIRLDARTGQKTFFNSMIAAYTGWIDSRNDPKKAVQLGDGTPVDAAAMDSVAEFMKEHRVAFKWQKGDILVIDNRVAMHSRNTFQRPRVVLASLAHDRPSSIDTETSASIAATVDAAVLRSGDRMPKVGFGVWKVPRNICAKTVFEAISRGYRHLDLACDYGNEEEVGQGIAQAIEAGIVKREDLFIVSKLWNTYHAQEHVPLALQKTLDDLKLEYLDLYLIHFPIALKFVPFEKRYPPEWLHDPEAKDAKMEFAKVPHFQTWAAMEALVDRKLVRNIGVCNYNTALFADLLNYARIPPAVIQVERHPYNTNSKLVRLASEAGVVVVGFSPLGASSYLELGMSEKRESVLANKTVQVIAGKYGKTPAQVVLRWALDTGCGVVPKTVKAHRMSENIDVFDFKLTQLEMEAIAALNIGRRFNDPGHFCQAAFNTFCPIYD